MWVFTKQGFFSAVCARQGDGKDGQPINPDRYHDPGESPRTS
jgi:hypothetical protein